MAPFLKYDTDMMVYEPIMFLSDYWVLKKDLILLNDTVNEANLTLHYNTYSINYFMFSKQFE
jgi:hypothetical protein